MSKANTDVAAFERERMNWGSLGNMRELGLLLIIVTLCVAMSFASPYFLTWNNFRAMLMSFSLRDHTRT